MNDLNKGLMALALVTIAGTISLPVLAGENGWHPRRHEVMARDRNLGRRIGEDKSKLHGRYNQLMNQDKAIKQQERADFKANGGYLTKGQKRQLNREENGLNNEIHQDRR